MIKTSRALLEELRDEIERLHSYEVPEVIALTGGGRLGTLSILDESGAGPQAQLVAALYSRGAAPPLPRGPNDRTCRLPWARRHDGITMTGAKCLSPCFSTGTSAGTWRRTSLASNVRSICDISRALRARGESGSRSGGARASGAADAMNEVLRNLRKIVVHHVRDSFHVNAAGRHIGRHQHPIVAVLEAAQRLVALALAAVAVDGAVFRPSRESFFASRSAPCLVRAKTRNEPCS